LPKIPADRISLQHVVLNLVMNAMECHGPGQGQPRGETRDAARQWHYRVIRVRHGPGIAAEMLPKIFDAFVTSKRDGIGLGLSIARSIVEAHRGSISASNTGQGAAFVITLPVS
jgi:signal transduction histidine kinase